MQLFPKIPSGMANRIDPDQTAHSGAIRSGSALFGICHFVRNFGAHSFRTFTILEITVMCYKCLINHFL